MTTNVLTAAFAQGGRITRYGDFTVVFLQACTFITTPMEFVVAQNWARGRMSCGNPARDRTAFVDRIDNVLARAGGGLATKGNRQVLAKIVKSMIANAMFMEEWSVPRNLNESMEIKRKSAVEPAV